MEAVERNTHSSYTHDGARQEGRGIAYRVMKRDEEFAVIEDGLSVSYTDDTLK